MYEKLFNLAPVQFGAVSPGIGIVLAERPCEVVVTVERHTRTEEKIVMMASMPGMQIGEGGSPLFR